MPTSQLQNLVGNTLYTHLGGYVIHENIRPEWLLTDRNERLELDFYIPELTFAVEVQGSQHYQYTPIFHKSYDDFKNQLRRDRAKKDLCFYSGVTLYEVSHKDNISGMLATVDTIRSQKCLPKISSDRMRFLKQRLGKKIYEMKKSENRLSELNEILAAHYKMRPNEEPPSRLIASIAHETNKYIGMERRLIKNTIEHGQYYDARAASRNTMEG